MPATLEQAMLDPVNTTTVPSVNPTITFNLGSREITIQTVVFRTASGVDHLTPPCAVPQGPWTVLFELEFDPSMDNQSVPIDGITQSSSTPESIIVISQPSEVSSTVWQFSLTNPVSDVNSISYQLSVGGVPHDPTIAVVKDPLDPPV